MSETTLVSICYIGEDSKKIQGNSEKIKEYLKQGFVVKEIRDSYWLLAKTACLMVTLQKGHKTKTFDMKDDICNYYLEKAISLKLAGKFLEDILFGKIIITMDDRGEYFFS